MSAYGDRLGRRLAAIIAARYPTRAHVVQVVDMDNVDVDCGDGLTFEQRDAADTVIERAARGA